MRSLFLCLFFFAPLVPGFAQVQRMANPFQSVPASAFQADTRQANPAVFQAFEADFSALEQSLLQVSAQGAPFTLELPVCGGGTAPFSLWRIDVMHPDLGARYPGIRTYAGEALDGSGRTVRVSTSMHGFTAMFMRSDMGIEMLEPWGKGTPNAYVLYDTREVPPSDVASVHSACGLHDRDIDPEQWTGTPALSAARSAGEPVSMRTYRTAVATTGHFALDHGGTVASVLAVVVDRVSRMSAILERDADIRLQLVPDNDKLIFLDPDNDPYSGQDVADWMVQNPPVLNFFIGENNYDLGHVFGRYFAGFAIGVASGANACSVAKARGSSAGFTPFGYGQSFVRTAVHEVGHQLSAGHTWNQCSEDAAAQRAGSSAFEPGSGTTLMSYAGSCGSNNVGSREDYYHAGTIMQIRNYTTQGVGATCGTVETVANNTPEATSLVPDSLYLPISTPFELQGLGTDADGDVLSFVWEQMDAGEEVPLGSEGFNSPLFRSFLPGSSPNRTFPRIQTIVGNINSDTELLPTQTRQLNFRLTARDNNVMGGGVHHDNVKLFVTNQAGPFLVLSPNTSNVTWTQGAWELVQWDVAGTDKGLVNCPMVDVLLSTDNGFTYPYTLASRLPNTGEAYVLVPAGVSTSAARIRVNGFENVFFDISNAPFAIQPAQAPGVSMGLSSTGGQVCVPEILEIDIYSSSLGGFNGPVTLDALSGLPATAVVTITPAVVNPGETARLRVDLSAVKESGNFPLQVRAKPAGINEVLLPLTFDLAYNDFSALANLAPADGAVGLAQTPVLHWIATPGAAFYEVEVAPNPSFLPGETLFSRSDVPVDSIQIGSILPKGNVFYWRVRAYNGLCYSDWTQPNAFATGLDQCQVFASTDLPVNISANAAATVQSVIALPAGASISDVNVTRLQGFHESFQHLDVRLTNPQGKEVLLFNGSCGSYNGTYTIGFDDAAISPLSCPPSKDGLAYKPKQSLSAFNGADAGGQWIVKMSDKFAGAGGVFTAFEFEVCSSVALSAPFLLNNQPLGLPAGNNAAITPALLRAEDANNGPDQLVYTLMTPPQFGHLEKNWGGPLYSGAQFTQAELDNGAIRYFDYGSGQNSDAFRFSVTDNEGGLVTGTFLIQPFALGVDDAGSLRAPEFSLVPNPSTGRVQVQFANAGQEPLRIGVLSADGRLLYEQVSAAGETATLLLGHLPDGLYLVQATSANGVRVKKLVIGR